MVITEMRSTHVPVEIFRFHIEREHVGQNGVHGRGDVFGRRSCEIGPRLQWGVASAKQFGSLSRLRFVRGFVLTGRGSTCPFNYVFHVTDCGVLRGPPFTKSSWQWL